MRWLGVVALALLSADAQRSLKKRTKPHSSAPPLPSSGAFPPPGACGPSPANATSHFLEALLRNYSRVQTEQRSKPCARRERTAGRTWQHLWKS